MYVCVQGTIFIKVQFNGNEKRKKNKEEKRGNHWLTDLAPDWVVYCVRVSVFMLLYRRVQPTIWMQARGNKEHFPSTQMLYNAKTAL